MHSLDIPISLDTNWVGFGDIPVCPYTHWIGFGDIHSCLCPYDWAGVLDTFLAAYLVGFGDIYNLLNGLLKHFHPSRYRLIGLWIHLTSVQIHIESGLETFQAVCAICIGILFPVGFGDVYGCLYAHWVGLRYISNCLDTNWVGFEDLTSGILSYSHWNGVGYHFSHVFG